MQGKIIAGVFAVLLVALGGFSCDKKTVAKAPDPGPSVPFEAPAKAGKPPPAPAEKPAEPSAKPQQPPAPSGDRFSSLAEKLPSPCGKAESLKRTLEGDPSCKSAPFAKRFLEKLIRVDVGDDEINELYRNRFGARENPTFTLRETPFLGTSNAPVTMVEFYDYACPHCREAAPVLERFAETHSHDVALYFKQFPLHKESMDTARAALAAQKQGKFLDMHKKLFENQGRQSREEITAYAKEIGLDMARFEKDMTDPALTGRINSDKEEGEKAKVQGTPAIWMNGRIYMDELNPDALADWLDEDLTVNR